MLKLNIEDMYCKQLHVSFWLNSTYPYCLVLGKHPFRKGKAGLDGPLPVFIFMVKPQTLHIVQFSWRFSLQHEVRH